MVPRATLIHGDVKQKLAETPGQFGLITGFDIIEHFTKSEIMPFVKQIARALSTGGRLILQTPNAESPWGLCIGIVILLTRSLLIRIAWSTCYGCRGLPIFKAGSADLTPMEVKSLIRFLVWRFIRLGLLIWNLAETGGPGSGICTRTFVLTAIKE